MAGYKTATKFVRNLCTARNTWIIWTKSVSRVHFITLNQSPRLEWECDCGHTERSEVAATGHQWDEGKVTKEATKNSYGVRTFTCTVCKKTRIEVIKADAAVSEPSDHVDTSEVTQSKSLPEKNESTWNTDSREDIKNPSLPEKGESAGELLSSNTEQFFRLSWWIIAAIALILIVGVFVGTIILRRRKKSC